MPPATSRISQLTSQLQLSKTIASQSRSTSSRAKLQVKTFATMAPAQVKSYDYVVVGGGSGGSGTARRAAGWYGARTLLVENGLSGGCCVNVG